MATVGEYPRAIWSSIFILFMLISHGATVTEAQTRRIPDDEMKALKEIAEQIGKKDWNLSLNYCDPCLFASAYGNYSWSWDTPVLDVSYYTSAVACNCTSDDVCHITDIMLKGQDLSGVLPPSLAKLPHLKTIDLTRNYLSGTIPREWASMNLEYMTVTVNRLSGPIPNYLGDITSLTYMSLENNMFHGTVPVELGKLVNLVNLTLSANNLTGQLPEELNKLSNLQELRLSRNNFKGKLPDFSSLERLSRLDLEASGFEGPIPSSIFLLPNLTELRITNLNRGKSTFPSLRNMKKIQILTLRRCIMSGKIPSSLANMPKLKKLDLSFNRLEGNVPELGGIDKLEVMYLTGNLLTGPIPEWIKEKTEKLAIDLSYNNFSEAPEPPDCSGTLNFYRSFSSRNYFEHEFLKGHNCPKDKQYSLHINCGGKEVTIGNTTYQNDEYPGGRAKFCLNNATWGTSTTGFFDGLNASIYIAKNVSILKTNNSQLYTKARLSPLSLTYYGRCLANGNYTVKLYFAEIILRNNRSFRSLGRRLFDVYIQDEIRLRDFDIEKIAGDVDKEVVRTFNNIAVKNNTIEIRFEWKGKGTTAVPSRGTYGPLVSAISIESNSRPPSVQRKKIIIVVGVVAPAICLICAVVSIIWWRRRSRSKTTGEQELIGFDLQTGLFTYRQIKASTNDFDIANKIGEGGFGSVYKGVLLDGTFIAVKQLSPKSKQGQREFVNEIGMISGLQHPNLVRLYGCCVERNQLLLVYEYMENNSLAQALFGPEECQLTLDWPIRLRICIGIARGLAFLHEESTLKIVHRDIKANNILLDRDLNPKISDFGLAKLDEEANSHITTRVAGTIGYMAPEYALWGYLTDKADVYSFGVVVLEIVAGKNNMKCRPTKDYVCLLDWALVLQQKRSLMDIVDPRLGSNFHKEEALKLIKVALLCTNPSPALRPAMSEVLDMLEGRSDMQGLIIDPSVYGDELIFKGLRDKYKDDQIQMSSETETTVSSSRAKQSDSSASAHDITI